MTKIITDIKISRLLTEDQELLRSLNDYFAIFITGHEFVDYFRRGKWDGKYHFFKRINGSFLTGLLDKVKVYLFEHDIDFEIEETKYELSTNKPVIDKLIGIDMEGNRSYQRDAVNIFLQKHRGIVKYATNSGKCLGKNTPVFMYNGSIKLVQDIVIGDLLMGDDSTPRQVLTVCNGIGELYQVNQRRLQSYIVNDSHILSLITTGLSHSECGLHSRQKINISILDYLKSSSRYKHIVKGYKVPIYFKAKTVKIDPYFLGLWLGDGRSNDVTICSSDNEIVNYLNNYATKLNLDLSKYPEPSKADSYHFKKKPGNKNNLLLNMRYYNLLNNKHIPEDYILNTEEVRLELLAGLIDTDGSLTNNNYEITQKSKVLTEGIIKLVNTLGLGISCSEKVIKGTIYYRMHIVGQTSKIPVKIPYKKCNDNKKHKLLLSTKIDIVPKGLGEYYGFTLDGNKKFLLGDGTVTHNTEVIAEIIRILNLNTLFIVDRKELLHQTVKRLEDRLGIKIGKIGDGFSLIEQVTVAMPQSLVINTSKNKRKPNFQVKPEFEHLMDCHLLILDECDTISDPRIEKTVSSSNAFYRGAFSGTPLLNDDVTNMKLIGNFGEVIAEVNNNALIELGVSSIPYCHIIKVDTPNIVSANYRRAYEQGIVNSKVRNSIIGAYVKSHVSKEVNILIIVQEIQHIKNLSSFIPEATVIHGSMSSKLRHEIIDEFKNRHINILISSNILDRGVDISNIDILILAGGGISAKRVLQRIGRGLRAKDSMKVDVVDFLDIGNAQLLRHSCQRINIMKSEGFRVELLK